MTNMIARFILKFTAVVLALSLFSGCGKMKRQSDKVVFVDNQTGSSPTGINQSEALRDLIQILSIYGNPNGDGSFTREGLTHMVEKFKPQLQSFLAGSGLKGSQLVDLLFAFDRDGNGNLNPREVLEGLKKRIKSIGWTYSTPLLTENDLFNRLTSDYPTASETAKKGLVKTLLLFDKDWAEGSNDGLIDARELSTPGIVMSLVENTDLSKGFKAPESAHGDAAHPTPFDMKRPELIEGQMNLKLKQQLTGRYESIDAKQLSTIDNKLEWMQLGLKFVLSDRAVKNITWDTRDEGTISLKQLRGVLTAMGFEEVVHDSSFISLVKYFDSELVGGIQNTKFDAIELFMLTTDLEFAKKFKELGLFQNAKVFATFFPYSEDSPTLENTAALDLAAIPLEFRFQNLTQTAFYFYDLNQNQKFGKPEMLGLLKEVYPAKATRQTVQFFFADAIPDDPKAPFDLAKGWTEYFKVSKQLTPIEVLNRVRKLIPRLL